MKQFILLLAACISFCSICNANSYNEPWQEQVLKQSESFVLLRIDSINEHAGVGATLIKNIAGKPVSAHIFIDDFFMLDMTSSSGDKLLFGLPAEMDTAYFFLKQGKNGHYSMPTPTAGFAWRKGDGVSATYRISLHKAYVPANVYERSMKELFAAAHGQKADKAYFTGLEQQYLKQAPSTPVTEDKAVRDLFFMQHVVLESMYFMGDASDIDYIRPFLKSDVVHNQISAVRALSGINTPAAKQELIGFLGDSTRTAFAQVMAVWALKRLNAREYKEQLTKLQKTASTETVDFGMNIMDVRIGTQIDEHVQAAIGDLLRTWK